MKEYEIGDKLVITCGCYSDYSIIDTYEVIKPFDYEEEILTMGFKSEDVHERDGKCKHRNIEVNEDVALRTLISRGLIKLSTHKELWLGDYSGVNVLLSDIEKYSK